MPPRHAYWTILIDHQPTAFRAGEVDELLPTFNRLKEKHPQTVMKWFERGKLWETRDEAQRALRQGYEVWSGGRLAPPRRPRARDSESRAAVSTPGREPNAEQRPPAADERDATPEAREARNKSWRPGGEHRDPREKYELAKKAKWQRLKQRMRAGERPFDRDRGRPDRDPGQPPQGPPAHDAKPPRQRSEDRSNEGRLSRPHDERSSAGQSRTRTQQPRDRDARSSSTRPEGSRPWTGARGQHRGPSRKGPDKPRGPR